MHNPDAAGRRRFLTVLGAGIALPRLAAAGSHDEWPTRPVRLIVPFAPGGPTDTVARLMAEQLQALWGQPVVVDYKPGGGTIVGTNTVAKSPADGYTLGMALSSLMINPGLRPELPYDTKKDLVGLSQVALAHFGLFAHPSVPFGDIAGLIAYARKNPGKLSYATPGIGGGSHLAGAMLAHMTGIDIVHVPYKGSSPAQQDVLAGRVPLLFDVSFSSMPYVRDGKLKVLALASAQRSKTEPQIPVIAETVPGYAAASTIGVIASSGLPAALVSRIGADLAKTARSPALSARMAELGMEAVGSTPAQYQALIGEEIDKWSQVIQAAGIQAE